MDFCGKLHRILFSSNILKPAKMSRGTTEQARAVQPPRKSFVFVSFFRCAWTLYVCVYREHLYTVHILDKSRLNIFILLFSLDLFHTDADTGSAGQLLLLLPKPLTCCWCLSMHVCVCNVCMSESFIQLVHHCSCGKTFWLAFNLSAFSFSPSLSWSFSFKFMNKLKLPQSCTGAENSLVLHKYNGKR